jgi:hypothetical protein
MLVTMLVAWRCRSWCILTLQSLTKAGSAAPQESESGVSDALKSMLEGRHGKLARRASKQRR